MDWDKRVKDFGRHRLHPMKKGALQKGRGFAISKIESVVEGELCLSASEGKIEKITKSEDGKFLNLVVKFKKNEKKNYPRKEMLKQILLGVNFDRKNTEDIFRRILMSNFSSEELKLIEKQKSIVFETPKAFANSIMGEALYLKFGKRKMYCKV